MVENHYGYGLRNDETPYAHKIPPGGNWRQLSVPEQKAFMKGSYGNGGGNAYLLRRMAWGEAAATLTAHPMGKATCQLHPGRREDGYVTTEKPLLDALPKLPASKYKAVSLFSGGGLLDLGAIHAGLDITWANDFEKGPVTAYQHNFGDHIVKGDITGSEMQALVPDCDIIVGGPPCQDFSVAGNGGGETG